MAGATKEFGEAGRSGGYMGVWARGVPARAGDKGARKAYGCGKSP